MNKQEELFRKVYIKSEEDLPKEEGMYFVAEKDYKYMYLLKFEHTKKYEYTWIRDIDWYLLPVEPIEQDKKTEEVKGTDLYNIADNIKETFLGELQSQYIQTRDLTDKEWLKLPKEEILQLYKNCYKLLIGQSQAVDSKGTAEEIADKYSHYGKLSNGDNCFVLEYTDVIKAMHEYVSQSLPEKPRELSDEEITDEDVMLYFSKHFKNSKDMRVNYQVFTRGLVLEFAKWYRDQLKKEDKSELKEPCSNCGKVHTMTDDLECYKKTGRAT